MQYSPNIITFKKFVQENIQKCYMKTTYPLNTEKLKIWVEAQSDVDIKFFTKIFCKYVTHISFQTWYNKLFNLAIDILDMINTNNYTQVIIITVDNFMKSNIWVAILLYNLLNDKVTDISSELEIEQHVTKLLA